MNPEQARTSSKNVNQEAAKLTTSTVIDFYEIDTTEVQFSLGLTPATKEDKIFRFHNSIAVTAREIYFRGEKYHAAPINAEGFETTTRGAPPRPKISIAVDFGQEAALNRLKTVLANMGDLTGSKFTRIRTFAKFIDADTNNGGDNEPNLIARIKNHDPDPNSILSYDIFYIERKAKETNRTLEYELNNKLDMENAFVPKRQVIQDRCQWQYRGEGCCYTDELREEVHGVSNANAGSFKNSFKTPNEARPVATESNELIYSTSLSANDGIFAKDAYTNRDRWAEGYTYEEGDAVFVEPSETTKIRYYFVAKQDHVATKTNAPPNSNFWIADQCSKSVKACKLRFNSPLPFGGYPAVAKVQR